MYAFLALSSRLLECLAQSYTSGTHGAQVAQVAQITPVAPFPYYHLPLSYLCNTCAGNPYLYWHGWHTDTEKAVGSSPRGKAVSQSGRQAGRQADRQSTIRNSRIEIDLSLGSPVACWKRQDDLRGARHWLIGRRRRQVGTPSPMNSLTAHRPPHVLQGIPQTSEVDKMTG